MTSDVRAVDDPDHLQTRRADLDYATSVIAAWASRYLPQLVDDIPDTSHGDGVSAIETGRGAFEVAMCSGEHRFLADEPVSVGGNGSGLSPHELVSAGLAACTVMTMGMAGTRSQAV